MNALINTNSVGLLVALCGLALSPGVMAAISFDPAVSFPAVSRPSGVAVADLNGDGPPDMAVATDFPDRITIRYSNAAMFDTPTFVSVFGSGARDLSATDVDGDGDKDL